MGRKRRSEPSAAERGDKEREARRSLKGRGEEVREKTRSWLKQRRDDGEGDGRSITTVQERQLRRNREEVNSSETEDSV